MLLRQAGYDAPIYIHGALQKLCDYHLSQGVPLGDLRPATVARGKKGDFRGRDHHRPTFGLCRDMGAAIPPTLSSVSPAAG